MNNIYESMLLIMSGIYQIHIFIITMTMKNKIREKRLSGIVSINCQINDIKFRIPVSETRTVYRVT